MSYKTIFTTYGLGRIASAQLPGGSPIVLAAMAVGDGNGNPVSPDPAQSALVREIYRHAVNRVYREDPANLTRFTAELIVPANIGGLTIREVGLFDDSGALFAVANVPEFYKPQASEGAFADTVIRLQFIVANAEVITLQVDPNVAIATHSWVLNSVTPAVLFPGGTTHQILRKVSNADGDTEWADPTAVNVTVDCIEETQTLAAGQTTVILAVVTTTGLAVYIEGVRLRLDQWDPDVTFPTTRIVLAQSYPAGTKIVCTQNEPNSGLNLSNYVKRAGDSMTGALAMGGNKVTGLAAGAANGDALAFNQAGAQVGAIATTGAISPVPPATGVAAGAYSGNSPVLQWLFGSGTAGNKLWDAFVNAKTLAFRLLDDTNTTGKPWMSVLREGVTSAVVTISDKLGVNRTPTEAFEVGGNAIVWGQLTGTAPTARAVSSLLGGSIVARARENNGDTNAAAFVTFDRNGLWAINFGLDTDNKLKVGGISMGNAAYEVWHAANKPDAFFHRYGGLGAAPGENANQQPYNTSAFTYQNAAPWNGTLALFGQQQYALQFNAPYQSSELSFRTQNGDAAGAWNPWRTVWHNGNFNPANYAPLNGTGANGTWNINIGGTANFANGAPWSGISGRPADFQWSHGVSGYVKMSNGTIIQWGRATAPSATFQDWSVGFPIAFPNACLWVSNSDVCPPGNGGYEGANRMKGFSSSAATFRLDWIGDNTGSYVAIETYWMAIGY